MAYEPLTPVVSSETSDVFTPEAYVPLSSQSKEYRQGLEKQIEADALVYAAEPAKDGVLSKIASFFKPSTPKQQEDLYKEAETTGKLSFKSTLKATLSELPQASRDVGHWLDNILIEKPAKLLADSDFKLISRGENIPIIKDIPGLGISPAKWFKEVANGLEYESADPNAKDNLGLATLKVAAQGTEAISGLTGGLYKPAQAAPDNVAGKFYKTFSEVVGIAIGLKAIGSGLFTLSTKSSNVANFINAYPRLSKVAMPLLINAGAFTAYGQLNPELAGDFKARMKQMALDASLSTVFTGLGFIANPKISIPASVGLGYGLAKLSGASNEDSIISGIVLGVLDGFARTGGRGRHGFISGEDSQKIMQMQASKILGVKDNASVQEINNAYRKLAKENHPDIGGDTKKMAQINAAHDFLIGKSEQFQKQAEADITKTSNEKSARETGITLIEQKPETIKFGELPKTEVVPKKEEKIKSEETNIVITEPSEPQKVVEELNIPEEIQTQAEADWMDNHAENYGKLAGEVSDLQKQLKEAKKTDQMAIQEKITAINTKLGDIENKFVEKWRGQVKKTEVPPKEKPDVFVSEKKEEPIKEEPKGKSKKKTISEEILKPKKETEKTEKTAQNKDILTLKPSKAKTLEESKKERISAGFDKESVEVGNLKTIPVPLITKTDLKTLLTNSSEFKVTPVLKVEEEENKKFLVFKGEKHQFKIRASALALNEDNLKIGDEIKVDEEALKEKGAEKQMRVFNSTGGVEASKGVFREGEPVELGNFDKVRPIEFPEIVSLARELMGKFPEVKKLIGKAGFHQAGRIVLNKDLFKKGNHQQLAATLAHEIGHLIDFLPDMTTKRGNLLGRLFTLRKFLSSTFDREEDTVVSMKELRNTATKEILDEEGYTFGDLVSGKVPDEVKTKIKERVQEMRDKTNYIKNEVINKELKAVSFWWRPFDPANPEGQNPAYRNSSKELYADAISVLFNTPGTLERMAPTFYKTFFEELDRKPNVKNEFFDLQELLSKGEEAVLAEREKGVREMFKKGEELWKIKQAEREEKAKSISFKLGQELIDINWALIQKVEAIEKNGGYINPDENPVLMLNAQNYVGGKVKAFMDKKIQPIYEDFNKNNISWEDFGVYLFWKRIALGDRSELANPLGHTPETAKTSLAKMEKDFGDEIFGVLEKNRLAFRDALIEISTEAYKSGLYAPELYQKMLENPAYAAFQVLEYLQDYVPASISHQVGTLKEIANTATSTLMKAVSTIRAIERNNSRIAGKKFLETNFPEEITPADMKFDGKKMVVVESRDPEKELITYMENGKIKGVYVDPYIADSYKKNTVGMNNAIVKLFSIPNNLVYRPLMITFSLGFQTFNLVRDFLRAWKSSPDISLWGMANQYRKALAPAIARGFGGKSDIITEMEEKKMLNFTFNDIVLDKTEDDQQIDKLFRKYGLIQGEMAHRFPKLSKLPGAKAFTQLLTWIEQTGNMIETLPKVAVYQIEKGTMNEAELGNFIRTRVGSPDFFRRGKAYHVTNNFFLFSNAIKEGIRGDYTTAFKDPRTKSGYWWRTAKLNFLPKLVMLLAALGLFGKDIKKAMDNVSEYDKTNYLIIPLSNTEDGRTWYTRIPQDFTGQLLGAMFWKGLNIAFNEKSLGKDVAQVFDLTAGQIPSMNPSIKVLMATGQFLAGQNPYDTFKGANVLTDDEFKAGGKYAIVPFLKWSSQQVGLGTIWRVDIRERAPVESSVLEKTLAAPLISSIIGRWIRVSNYGQIERNKDIIAEVDSEKAKVRIEERSIINDAVRKFQKGSSKIKDIKLDATKEAFSGQVKTKAEIGRFQKKIDVAIIRGQADPNINSLISATTVDAQLALLQSYKKTMEKADFDEMFGFVQKQKIISHDTATKFGDLLKKQE